MTEAKVIPINGKAANGQAKLKGEGLTKTQLKDLHDYKADMEKSNAEMKLLDKKQQAAAKTKRGRNFRGGYHMAMVILNANNESIRALQNERNAWFKEWEKVIELNKNAQKMVDIQTQLAASGHERENALTREHNATIREYQNVILKFKQYPDKLTEMLKDRASAGDIVRALEDIDVKK